MPFPPVQRRAARLLLCLGIYCAGWWHHHLLHPQPAPAPAQSAAAQLPPPSAHPPGYLTSKKAPPAPPAAGAEALTKLLEQRAKSEDLGAALAAWAEQDPDSAFRALLTDSRLQRPATVRALFEVLGKNDPAQALQRLAELPAVPWARQANQGLATGWTQRDPNAATTAGLALPPGISRVEFLQSAFAQWTRQDLIAAKAWFMALPPEESRLHILTPGSVEKGQVHNAQEMDAYLDFGQINADPWGDLELDPFKGWLKKSPEAALQWALALPQDGPHTQKLLGSALDSVASDPARVLSLLPQLKNFSSCERLVTSAAEAWAQRDPIAAWAWATQLNPPDLQSVFESKLAHDWTAADPATAIPWLLQNQPGQRMNIDPEGAKYWATSSPETALATLAQLRPTLFPMTFTSDVLEGIAQTNPTASLSHLHLLQDSVQRYSVIQTVMTTWSQQDITAASAYTDALPPGEDRQAAIKGILEAAFKESPESALTWATTLTDPGGESDRDSWAASLHDPERRAKSVGDYLDKWRKKDPTAAQNWLDHAPLDDALRQKLTPSQP